MPADPTLKHSNSPEGTDIHAPEAKSEQEKDVESTSASVASFAVNSENASAGEKETPQSLDWDGPDDPDDPMNWPVGRKVYSTLTTGLMSFAVFVTSGESDSNSALTALAERSAPPSTHQASSALNTILAFRGRPPCSVSPSILLPLALLQSSLLP